MSDTRGNRKTEQIVIYGRAQADAGGRLAHAPDDRRRPAPALRCRHRERACRRRGAELSAVRGIASRPQHPPPDLVPLKRALISVSDKTGLVDFARALAARGVEIVSTGGTRAALAAAGIAVTDVAAVTGFPEIMDGRVKTLHPTIHGGLLGVRDDAGHAAAMAEHGIAPIDLLVVNLYPFEATVAAGADYATAVENIDIGGPAMIRAARQEPRLCRRRRRSGRLCRGARRARRERRRHALALRQRLAAKAFARTAAYDAAISAWFAGQVGEDVPAWRSFAGRLGETLRYGENPHQSAALYLDRRAAARRRHRPPGPGQGALLQQHQRHRRRLRAGRRVRPGSELPRSPSSSTPIPAASRSARRSPRPIGRRSAAIRSRPSAASSR